MAVHNNDIARIFMKVADLLEIEGANPFRVRAYRNAARTVASLPQSMVELLEQGHDPSDLPGIGKDLAGKIKEIVDTGDLELLREMEGRLPPGLNVLMKIPGLGPKRVQTIHKELRISSLEELKEAAQKGRIRQLAGLGEKIEQSILDAIEWVAQAEQSHKISDVEGEARAMRAFLSAIEGVRDVVVAGSYRRRKETVRDLDILVTGEEGAAVTDAFVKHEDVAKVYSHGPKRASVELRSGLQVDLRVVAQQSYGAALHYFTGSKAHNIAVRTLGVRRGLKINEYGVFRGDQRVAGEREEEVFQSVGLPYIEPELREDRGEIQAARQGKLPRLITLDQIRGDLHTHTVDSDGRNTLEEMVLAARDRGYEYIAITNHSKATVVAHGLDAKRLAQLNKLIDHFRETIKGIVILKGIEVDILADGSLDLEDEILRDLDLTVCSVHSRFNLPAARQTERIIRAMDNPHFNILAHPTGRLINEREPYDLDMERLMEAAKERGCVLELNAHPDRLDLSDVHCQMAREMGLKVVISTDAHSVSDLNLMIHGIGQARRGWLEADNVVNTRGWPEVREMLRRL